MDLSGRRVLVVGLGRTGVATARFLVKREAKVIIIDEKPASELESAIRDLGSLNVDLQLGKHNTDILPRFDLVVPSPGVPPFNYLLAGALERGIPIISEIELASGFIKKPMIAITGTNGKTTTTKLVGKMLLQWGKKIFEGGNIGNPLIAFVDGEQREDYLVVEVSSFQLQWVDSFHPFISVLLNVSPDHLDYHGTFDEYRRVKERLFTNHCETDVAVLNADDPVTESLSEKIAAKVKRFSSSFKLEEGIFIDGSVLRYRDRKGRNEEYPLEGIKLPGNHNLENIMAAILVSRSVGCPRNKIIDALADFEGIPHRMEFVGVKNGVKFYNDSKGTNVDAVARALEIFPRPVILLLGGRDKGGDFTVLSGLILEKVRELIFFGEAGKQINSLVGGIVTTKITKNLKEAVTMAWNDSVSGDVVLLSPGCASFDEFASYEARGNFFKDFVRSKVQG
ncbi:MAG: UDP-N-acetylmuramoyl-L-alanine--D-glutamate ligase [Syntrophobacterales bacterium]|nr:UDP-N-acetylmuramoyl-L-alanine--D-glutamate ligase [Syntrophobacterales bacterium]